MTTLVSADWHLNDSPLDSYRHDFVRRLPAIVTNRKIDRLIIAGDLTDQKDRHSAVLVNTVVDHIMRLSAVCEVVILRGNHDGHNPQSPFFKFLGYLPRVRWINNPTAEGKWLYLPHGNHDWTKLDSQFDLIFAHTTFTGAVGQNGQALNGTPIDVIPAGVRVLSGDVHVPQQVGPVTYIGAPFTVHFGDTFRPRVLLIHNDGRITSLRTGGVQKRLLDITPAEMEEAMPQCNAGDIIKIRVHITEHADAARWHEIRNELRAWGQQHDYQIHSVQFINPTILSQPTLSEHRSDDQWLDEFAAAQKLDDNTVKLGKNLVRTTP